ncbi:MAG: hypothetical protein OEZ32_04315 [Nitrospinota bacterium]|nr:hypothetical protein [Nitrospinota bacterium]
MFGLNATNVYGLYIGSTTATGQAWNIYAANASADSWARPMERILERHAGGIDA